MRLWPNAMSIDHNGVGVLNDDVWIVWKVIDEDFLELENIRTMHRLQLDMHQIHHFDPDSGRKADGLSYGFLVLKGVLVLTSRNIYLVSNRSGEQ